MANSKVAYLQIDTQKLLQSLKVYEASKQLAGEKKTNKFMQAVDMFLNGLGILPPHKQELKNALEGKYADTTKALLAKLSVTLVAEMVPVGIAKAGQQDLFVEFCNEILKTWTKQRSPHE